MAQATGRDIVSAKGFWDKPERDQVSALAAVSPKFKSSNPQVQRATLKKLHELSSNGISPSPASPSTSAPKSPSNSSSAAPPPNHPGPPTTPKEADLPENQPGIHFPSLSEVGRIAKNWALGGEHSIQAAVRPSVEGAAGWAAGAVEKLSGAPKESQDFSKGIAEGLAGMGIDMTTPANIAMIGAMVFGGEIAEGGKILSSAPKAARLLKLLPKAAKMGFQGEQVVDLLKSIDGGTEAWENKDFEGLGKAAARTIADALLIEGARRSGKSKAPAAEPPSPTAGRFSPPTENAGIESEWNRLVEETKKKSEEKTPAAKPPDPVRSTDNPYHPKSTQEAERRVLAATEVDRQRREEELIAQYDKSKSRNLKPNPQGPPKLPAASQGRATVPPPSAQTANGIPAPTAASSQSTIAPPVAPPRSVSVPPEFDLVTKKLSKGIRRDAPGGAAPPETGPESENLVQRYGETSGDPNSPAGSYHSPANTRSAYAGREGKQWISKRNPEATVLSLEEVRETRAGLEKSGDNASAGVLALRQLAGPKEFARLRGMKWENLRGEAEKLYPDVDWGQFKDKQQVIEVMGAMKARAEGYDAVELKDENSPHRSEYLALNDKALTPREARNPSSPAARPPGPLVQRGTANPEDQVGDQLREKGRKIEESTKKSPKATTGRPKASGAPANPPPERVTTPETKATKGAGAPDTPQQAELNQAVRSIFEQADTGGLEGVKITAVDADGKVVYSLEHDVDHPPLAVARDLSRHSGIVRIDVEPIGGSKGIRKWSKFLTGKTIETPPLNRPKAPPEPVAVNF